MQNHKTAIIVFLFFILGLSACSQLPKDNHQVQTNSLPSAPKTPLAKLLDLQSTLQADPLSYFHLIDRNADAFMWRLSMIETAQKSLDIQVYLLEGDSGTFILDRLLTAADRGVRVRLLIDDLALPPGTARKLASLNLHPNFEMRLFNPIKYRGKNFLAYWLNFAVNLNSLNMRMHNKLFIADNQVGIIGGRNIGDTYFGLDKHWNFLDTDLLCAGPIVTDISGSFDLFWNSPQAWPIDSLTDRKKTHKKMAKIRKNLKKKIDKTNSLKFFKDKPEDPEKLFKNLAGKMIPGNSRLLYDTVSASNKKWNDLQTYLLEAKEETIIISPYFTPTEEMLNYLETAIKGGEKVTFFTNSLATNDVIWVNAIFKKYRKRIVEMDIDLFELRKNGTLRDKYDTPPVKAKGMSLHSKVILLDKKRVYVGSLNMDHRAWHLNTEVGVVVDSPELYQVIYQSFQKEMSPANSWHVTVSEAGQLYWTSDAGRKRIQPAGSFWRRVFEDFLTDMPKRLEEQM